MIKIEGSAYDIEIGNLLEGSLASYLENHYKNSKIVVLVDENTNEFCLPVLLQNFEAFYECEVVMIPAGEEYKVLEICVQVWEAFTDFNLSRKDLVINLGGGMVSDLGGFVASVFKRGIDVINIPTSLLAMVDASVGGKTGIDFGNLKNQLGTFSTPKAIFVDINFLETLPEIELLNGYAEMLKHGLITDVDHWNELIKIKTYKELIDEQFIATSINIKNKIVKADFTELGVRKKLNFGHTIGHALEGFFLDTKKIHHGNAVALGILVESFISHRKNILDHDVFTSIEKVILLSFPLVYFEDTDMEALYNFCLQDKKNDHDEIHCVLLKAIGDALEDVKLEKNEVIEGLIYLKNLNINLN